MITAIYLANIADSRTSMATREAVMCNGEVCKANQICMDHCEIYCEIDLTKVASNKQCFSHKACRCAPGWCRENTTGAHTCSQRIAIRCLFDARIDKKVCEPAPANQQYTTPKFAPDCGDEPDSYVDRGIYGDY